MFVPIVEKRREAAVGKHLPLQHDQKTHGRSRYRSRAIDESFDGKLAYSGLTEDEDGDKVSVTIYEVTKIRDPEKFVNEERTLIYDPATNRLYHAIDTEHLSIVKPLKLDSDKVVRFWTNPRAKAPRFSDWQSGVGWVRGEEHFDQNKALKNIDKASNKLVSLGMPEKSAAEIFFWKTGKTVSTTLKSLVVKHLAMQHDQQTHAGEMYHGTTAAAAKAILAKGLLVSKTKKDRTPGKKGVYATNALKSAVEYGQNRAELAGKDTFGVVVFSAGEPTDFNADWGFARFDKDIPASKIVRIEIRRTKDLALVSMLKSVTIVEDEFYVPVLFDDDDYELVDVDGGIEKHLAGKHDQSTHGRGGATEGAPVAETGTSFDKAGWEAKAIPDRRKEWEALRIAIEGVQTLLAKKVVKHLPNKHDQKTHAGTNVEEFLAESGVAYAVDPNGFGKKYPEAAAAFNAAIGGERLKALRDVIAAVKHLPGQHDQQTHGRGVGQVNAYIGRNKKGRVQTSTTVSKPYKDAKAEIDQLTANILSRGLKTVKVDEKTVTANDALASLRAIDKEMQVVEEVLPGFNWERLGLSLRIEGGYDGANASYEPKTQSIVIFNGEGETFIHELGHAIDHQQGYASQVPRQFLRESESGWARKMSDVVAIVETTADYKAWSNDKERVSVRGNTFARSDYLTRKTEIFARVFDQYVNVKSGGRSLSYVDADWVHTKGDRKKVLSAMADVLKSIPGLTITGVGKHRAELGVQTLLAKQVVKHYPGGQDHNQEDHAHPGEGGPLGKNATLSLQRHYQRVDTGQTKTVKLKSGKTKKVKIYQYIDSQSGKAVTDPAELDRIRKLVLPPGVGNVKINPDPNGRIQAQWRDVTGKSQSRYSKAHDQAQAAEKFTRLKAFTKQLPKIRAQVLRDLKSDDEATREAAAVVYLVDKTAFRIGNDNPNAKVKAYGASTLQNGHVRVEADGNLVFDFIGKKGVRIRKAVNDPTLTQIVEDRKTSKWSDPLFQTTYAKVNQYFDGVAGKSFLVKDFRTHHATEWALSLMDKRKGRPKTEKAFSVWQKDVATRVAAKMGHTASVSLNQYINPLVWDRWRLPEWGAWVPPKLKSEAEDD